MSIYFKLSLAYLRGQMQHRGSFAMSVARNLISSVGDLLRLVRQIYRRTQSARQSRRPPSQTDQRYMKRAEDLLYGELAVALGIPREEVVPYIAHRLEAAKS